MPKNETSRGRRPVRMATKNTKRRNKEDKTMIQTRPLSAPLLGFLFLCLFVFLVAILAFSSAGKRNFQSCRARSVRKIDRLGDQSFVCRVRRWAAWEVMSTCPEPVLVY